MKVFMINDYEWWAAETLEEAITACMEQEQLSREEAYDENSKGELSEEEMKHLRFTYDDESACSFHERLQEMIENNYPFPCLFASTEF